MIDVNDIICLWHSRLQYLFHQLSLELVGLIGEFSLPVYCALSSGSFTGIPDSIGIPINESEDNNAIVQVNDPEEPWIAEVIVVEQLIVAGTSTMPASVAVPAVTTTIEAPAFSSEESKDHVDQNHVGVILSSELW